MGSIIYIAKSLWLNQSENSSVTIHRPTDFVFKMKEQNPLLYSKFVQTDFINNYRRELEMNCCNRHNSSDLSDQSIYG